MVEVFEYTQANTTFLLLAIGNNSSVKTVGTECSVGNVTLKEVS